MGGRGSASGMSGSGGGTNEKALQAELDYKPYAYGQITRKEAGTIYRAQKEGKIKTLPETTKTLYNETEYDLRLSRVRYNQHGQYYDNIYKATADIIAGEYKAAQKRINEWESQMIKNSGKKSIFYKYKKK